MYSGKSYDANDCSDAAITTCPFLLIRNDLDGSTPAAIYATQSVDRFPKPARKGFVSKQSLITFKIAFLNISGLLSTISLAKQNK